MDKQLEQCLVDFMSCNEVQRMAMRLAIDDQLMAPNMTRDRYATLSKAREILRELDDKITKIDTPEYTLRRPI
jgi:hypothetical protein